ncbi:polyprenol monophosphomannose synthase [Buchananella hordeovulneris]|uniref:polyprenol monophosphomannose synthase n=1 Tax=Buchananella hordeovulneris TaxID=52770 RepID=UPI000F5D50C9|nr:polyprenol monophosphomannose synthase [Buchananella hordeovulneris]RRD45400.1 polyprenol monophosphomannose synthase [Buchananella hordeovulneris]
MRVLVCIPTYNEMESLPGVLARLRAAVPEAHVLIADDASPDGTGQWADERASEDEHIHVLHRTQKEGLGPAYLAAFRWGLEHGYDLLCEMDADGSHRPEQLALLLHRAQAPDAPDLVIGSRWVRGGGTVGWPLHRKLLSRGGSLWTEFWLGMGVRDATAGFRVYRADLLRRLNLASVESAGYCFQIDMTRRVDQIGGSIAEVPISFVERAQGVSKMSGSIVTEALARTAKWGLTKRKSQLQALLARRR